jgi:hypothetical protein
VMEVTSNALDTWMPVQTHEGGIHKTGVHL